MWLSTRKQSKDRSDVEELRGTFPPKILAEAVGLYGTV